MIRIKNAVLCPIFKFVRSKISLFVGACIIRVQVKK